MGHEMSHPKSTHDPRAMTHPKKVTYSTHMTVTPALIEMCKVKVKVNVDLYSASS